MDYIFLKAYPAIYLSILLVRQSLLIALSTCCTSYCLKEHTVWRANMCLFISCGLDQLVTGAYEATCVTYIHSAAGAMCYQHPEGQISKLLSLNTSHKGFSNLPPYTSNLLRQVFCEWRVPSPPILCELYFKCLITSFNCVCI